MMPNEVKTFIDLFYFHPYLILKQDLLISYLLPFLEEKCSLLTDEVLLMLLCVYVFVNAVSRRSGEQLKERRRSASTDQRGGDAAYTANTTEKTG